MPAGIPVGIPGGPGEQLLFWQVMTDVCGRDSGCRVCTVGEDCTGSVCTSGGDPSAVGGVDLAVHDPDMTACAVVGGGGDTLQLSVECQL